VETYDEIVFPEPTEAFFQRVQNHPAANVPRLPPGITLPPPGIFLYNLYSLYFTIGNAKLALLTTCYLGSMEIVPYEKKRGDTKDHHLSPWFSNFSEADELLKLAAAQLQVRLIAGSNCPYFLCA